MIGRTVLAVIPVVCLLSCGEQAIPDDAQEVAASPSTQKTIPRAIAQNAPGHPEKRDHLFDKASNLVAMGHHAQAIRVLEKAIATGPEDAKTRMLLGVCRSNVRSDVRGAHREISRARDLAPDLAEPWLLLARLADEMGDPAEALRNTGDALVRDPLYPEALVFQARLLRQSGRENEAQQVLDALIESEFTHAGAFYERGLILLRADQLAAAASDFKTAVALEPTDTRARFNLANALRGLGETEEASRVQGEFDLLKTVFSPSAHDHETDIHKRAALLRKMREKFPSVWRVRLELVNTTLAANGRTAAQAVMAEAVRDFPDVAEARVLDAALGEGE